MIGWWNSLTLIEQILAAVSFASTAVLLLQTLLLLISVGGGEQDFDAGGHDIDADGHDLDLHDMDGHDFDSHDFDGHDHDSSAVHDPGLRIFTVRGFVTFFCIFGWSGLVMLRRGVSLPVSLSVAVVLGIIFMVLVAFCFALFFRLQSSGNVEASAAVGLSGTVYIPIPSRRSGSGKITANVAGRFSEYDAVTDGEEDIPTGAAVTVVSVTGADTLVVVKK